MLRKLNKTKTKLIQNEKNIFFVLFSRSFATLYLLPVHFCGYGLCNPILIAHVNLEKYDGCYKPSTHFTCQVGCILVCGKSYGKEDK